MRNKKRKISPEVEAESTENQAPVPFFAKKIDPEALRSIRAGEDRAVEIEWKLKGG